MERPSVRSYRIRGSRITDAQREAKTALQAVHGIEFKQELIDLKAIFPRSEKVIMEIGFGMGEATAIIAKNHPNNGYIAVDVHPPGIGKLLARIAENDLTNLKVIEEDVHVVLQHMVADESLDGIHLFFPDPWPKNRQHKRRMVQSEFIEMVGRKLKQGGFIHIATDWQPYADWIKVRFDKSDSFSGGVVDRPNWRVLSKFEGQGLRKGHQVTDFKYIKN